MNKDIIGNKFGKLTVIKETDKRDNAGCILYECKCDCGNITYAAARRLKSGHIKSCGCTRKEKFKKHSEELKLNLAGKKFGRLTVISNYKSNKNGKPIWNCKCECGNTTEVLGESLISGNTKSCGCIGKETITEENKKNNINNSNIAIVKSLLNNSKSHITKSGVKGVCWDNRQNKWRAYIMLQTKYYHLGYFTDLKKAIDIRKKAEEKLFGEFIERYKENYKK